MPLSATLCSWTQSLPPAALAQLPPVRVASFGVGDSLFLVVMALIVFGPKKLPEISRQVGKLLYEFRKASNDFKFQIEEELRSAEQAERQKQLQSQAATPQAATPVAITAGERVSAEPAVAEALTTEAAGTETAPEPQNGEPLGAEPQAAEPVSTTSGPASGPMIQPPSSGLPVSSRSPYAVTENIEGATAVTAAGESLDEMQANAQEAVRSAAADPSYNHQHSTESGDTVPTHHG